MLTGFLYPDTYSNKMLKNEVTLKKTYYIWYKFSINFRRSQMRPERLTNGKHDIYILLLYKITFEKEKRFFFLIKRQSHVSIAKEKKSIFNYLL